MWMHYVHFEAVLGFTRKEQMRCSQVFRGNNANGDTRNVTSDVGTPMNVIKENMTRPREVQKCRKNSQKLRYNTHF